MKIRNLVSSATSLAIAMASLVSLNVAHATSQELLDADFWTPSQSTLVARLASSSDSSQILTASEISAATSVSLVIPMEDSAVFSDFEYWWYQGDTDNGCSAFSAQALGSRTAVPSTGVIPIPAFTPGRSIYLTVFEGQGIDAYARTTGVQTGSSPKFCSPENVSLESVTAGELSVTLTFGAESAPENATTTNLSAYLIPADSAVPSDLTNYDNNGQPLYPNQVGCSYSSCYINVDSGDVGNDFDVVFRAQWFVDSAWVSSYWSIARVSVTPLAQHVSCSSPSRTPDCSRIDLLTQPTLDISGGTDPGDTIVIATDSEWDTNEANIGDDYSWWSAASCDAQSWSREFFFESNGGWEIPTMRTDFSTIPPTSRQVEAGLVFRLGSTFDNGYVNIEGFDLGPSFVVGGGLCSSSVVDGDNDDDSVQEDTTSDVVRAAPYTGPVLNTPSLSSRIAAGGKVVIPGSNLSGVSAVEIGGLAATVVVNSDGELEITVPAGLAAGTYDLVVVSSSGKLTVQNAITVSGSAVDATAGSATPSTKRMGDDSAKVWVFDVVGAGKVQIFVNGKEIAWVNTTDSSNSKLTNGYLVRTVELAEGKNIIEVFVDSERVRRTVYSN